MPGDALTIRSGSHVPHKRVSKKGRPLARGLVPLKNQSDEAIQRAVQAATGAFISVQDGGDHRVMALEHTQASTPDELRSWISMQLYHAAIAYLR